MIFWCFWCKMTAYTRRFSIADWEEVCYTQVRLTSKHSDLIPWKTAACPPSLTPNMSESALEKIRRTLAFFIPWCRKAVFRIDADFGSVSALFSRNGARLLQILFHGWCMAPGDGGGAGGGRGCGWKWQNIGTNDENKMEGNIVFQNNSLIFRI